MFRCDLCSSVTGPGTPKNKIVVERRDREYPLRPKVHYVPGSDGGKGKWVDDPGGRGHEIVREIDACPGCAAKARAIERRVATSSDDGIP